MDHGRGSLVPPLAAWTLFAAAKRGRLRDGALFALIVSAVFAPWLMRNARLCGDPLYPFLYRWFARSREGLLGRMAQAYLGMAAPFARSNRWRDLIAPGAGGVDVLGGLGWGPTLALVPLGLWAARKDSFLTRLSFFCGLYVVSWYLTGTIVRFLTVLLPLLCLLAAAGLHRAWSSTPPGIRRGALAAGAGALVAYQVALFFYVHALLGTPRVLLGAQSRDEFLARHVDYYPCARFAAERLPGEAKLLLLGEQRGYYVEQEHAGGNPYAPDARIAWADEASGPRELAKRLRDAGFTDVLFVPREAQRLGAFASLTDAGRRNWAGLAAGPARLVYQDPACALYSLGAR